MLSLAGIVTNSRQPQLRVLARPAKSSLKHNPYTSLLYGETSEQQERALAAPDPLVLPWIAAALARLAVILADLAP